MKVSKCIHKYFIIILKDNIMCNNIYQFKPDMRIFYSGYDVPALNRYLDWIAVMTYDFHGQWDKKTGHVAPMYYHPEDEIDYFNMVSC